MKTREEMNRLLKEIEGKSVEQARKIVNAQLVGTELIAKDAFQVAVYLRAALYQPTDKGRTGKLAEIQFRVEGWKESGRTWARWNEFNARKQGKADSKQAAFHKAGAGNWLRSKKAMTRDEVLKEYITSPIRRNQTFRFIDEDSDFCIEGCTLGDFLDYLAEYKNGLETWFKSNVSINEDTTVVDFQGYKTSAKKLKYLRACPWNIWAE